MPAVASSLSMFQDSKAKSQLGKNTLATDNRNESNQTHCLRHSLSLRAGRLPRHAVGPTVPMLLPIALCLQAFADTILVIAIVAATGSLLFGVNVLLTEGSEWWYHR